MNTTPKYSYNDPTPEAAAERGRQADIDCDIEGMANDPRLSALTDQWLAEGVSRDEYFRRLRKAMSRQDEPVLAAE